MKKILSFILKILAGWTIAKYRPGIIAITGSVGKTSTKEAIYAVLKNLRQVRAASGNFNNELGVPLTVISDKKKILGLLFWPKVIFGALKNLIVRQTYYPEILVLEYAADRPGDIKYLVEIARPQIGVVTAVGETPVHVEFYSGPEAVSYEKSQLIQSLPPNGWAILNYDDEITLAIKEKSPAPVFTFGFGEGADLRVGNWEVKYEGGSWGMIFKLIHQDRVVPVRLLGVVGKGHAYAAAAAVAVGLCYGLNILRATEYLFFYQPAPHRGQILPGIKGTWVIDDSYNASPLSMRSALQTLKAMPAKRRVAVVGDMLELGVYSPEAHEELGRLAAKTAEVLIAVGLRAPLVSEAAEQTGLKKDSIFTFATALEAGPKVQALINPGDVVLVKASRGIGLEKIVEEIRQM